MGKLKVARGTRKTGGRFEKINLPPVHLIISGCPPLLKKEN
jgi:hypothetical protein